MGEFAPASPAPARVYKKKGGAGGFPPTSSLPTLLTRPAIYLILGVVLALAWALAPDRLTPVPALATEMAEPGPQQATPTPEQADGASAPKRRDMTGAALALTLLCMLNAIGLGVMIGLSKRMQTVAEEALKQKRRSR